MSSSSVKVAAGSHLFSYHTAAHSARRAWRRARIDTAAGDTVERHGRPVPQDRSPNAKRPRRSGAIWWARGDLNRVYRAQARNPSLSLEDGGG